MLLDMDNRNYIWGIPDLIFSGILSAIVAASIALLGTWLQGWKQAKLQSQQLAHDAGEKSKEREMSLRRDVYLPAADGIAKLQEYLKSYSSVSISATDRGEIIRNVWGTFNKIAIIGSIETIEVFNKIFLRFSELDAPLLLKDTELYQIDLELDLITKNKEQLVAQIEQNWKVLNSGNVEYNSREYAELEKEIETIKKSIQGLSDEIKRKRLYQNDLRFYVVEEISHAVAEIEELMAEANIAIRREINLPLDDEKRYRQSIKDTNDRMQKSLQETIEKCRKQLPDFIEKIEKRLREE